jgi:DNA-binding transcriptional LysR family regulator
MPRAPQDWQNRIGRRVTLRDLHILSAVVRSGSMAKAAKHLAMSQSAVSESVAHLEDALRVRLLDRGVRGVEPTIYANVLLRRGHAVFDELQQGIKEIDYLADPSRGEVRIACTEILSYGYLPTAIDHLSLRHPQVAVRVTHLNTESLELPALQEREVDFVIARVPDSYRNDELDIENLWADSLMVIVGAQSPWARKRKVSLAELANERWILPPTPYIRSVLQKSFEARGTRAPLDRVTANSIQLRIRLLATGRFVSVLADSVFHENAKRWSLTALPIDLAAKPPPWSIVKLKNRTVSPVVDIFIDLLRNVTASTSAIAKRPKA